MTRDELIDRLAGTMHQVVDSMWVGDRPTPPIEALMEHVDAYVQDERERRAQAIDEKATEMQDGRLLGRDRGAEARSYLAAGMRMAARTVREGESS